MSTELIGYRVVANKACDNFELQQAAMQCMQILTDKGVPARWFRVTKEFGREELQALDYPPPVKKRRPTKSNRKSKES